MGFEWTDGHGRRVVADDEARTVTEYVDGEVVDVRDYTADQVERLRARIVAAVRLDDLEARVAALEALHTAADPDDPTHPDVPTWDDLVPAGWWYDETLLADVDGTVYRNTSGTVLTMPPSAMPSGGAPWLGSLFVVAGDPAPSTPEGYVGAWSADATYAVGDVVDHGGHYWRCLLAHGPERQGTWAPGPATPTIWADLGPTTSPGG